jgi:hypothetical protein
MFKAFDIYESLKLQFRAESFNLLNTPTFNNPNSGISTTVNGVPVVGSGIGQIGSTTASASPRQIQFALKLLF